MEVILTGSWLVVLCDFIHIYIHGYDYKHEKAYAVFWHQTIQNKIDINIWCIRKCRA